MKPVHLSLGNINLDIYLYVERLPAPDEELPVEEAMVSPGGAASNYAVAAVAAGHRAKLVAHTSRVAVSLGVLDALRKKGVDVDSVVVHEEGMPGLVVIVVASGGETVMFKVRGVNRLLRGDEISGEYDVVHVASAQPEVMERVMASVRARIYSYDPGGAVAIQYPSRVAMLLGRVTILSLNAREAVRVLGASIGVVQEKLGDSMLLVRLGARGSLLVTSGRGYYARACRLGEPVDTTGAGDTFNAYFNAWLAEGTDVEEALAAGTTAAALKILRKGAQNVPSREEVEGRLAECRYGVRMVNREEAERLLAETVA